mgnify:CR=1 FL=1
MIEKIAKEIEFWQNLRAHSLAMAQEAQERGLYDEVAQQNYFACNAIVCVLNGLLK